MASETPNTKFLREIKGPSSDYGGSDVDEALLEAVDSQASPLHGRQGPTTALIDDAGTDYGSDFDSEAEEEITRILAEIDGAGTSGVVTEPLIEETENESGRKFLVHVPVVASGQESSGSGTRTTSTTYHTARQSTGSDAQQVSNDIELPDLSSRMCAPFTTCSCAFI